jgi:hypothetical protein
MATIYVKMKILFLCLLEKCFGKSYFAKKSENKEDETWICV